MTLVILLDKIPTLRTFQQRNTFWYRKFMLTFESSTGLGGNVLLRSEAAIFYVLRKRDLQNVHRENRLQNKRVQSWRGDLRLLIPVSSCLEHVSRVSQRWNDCGSPNQWQRKSVDSDARRGGERSNRSDRPALSRETSRNADANQ